MAEQWPWFLDVEGWQIVVDYPDDPCSGRVPWLLPPCLGAGFKVMLDRDHNLTLVDVALVEPRVPGQQCPASSDVGGEVVGFIRVDQVEHPTFEPLVRRAEESGSDCNLELVEGPREPVSELVEEQRELDVPGGGDLEAPPGSREHLVVLDAEEVGSLMHCVACIIREECGVDEPCLESSTKGKPSGGGAGEEGA